MMERLKAAAVARLRRLVIRRKAHAYRAIFRPSLPAAQVEADYVLGDLARFCRATIPTFDPDARQSARLEGRREVWLRIQGFLNFTEAQMRELREVEDDVDE